MQSASSGQNAVRPNQWLDSAPPYHDTLDLGDRNRPTTQIFEAVPAGCRVLDIGCATGYLARALRDRRGCRVTGIEVDPRAARLAADACDRILVGDVEQEQVLAQAGGDFDVIIMADVLEHLRRPEQALCRLRGRLAPGGMLLLSVPNIAHFSIRKQALLGRLERTERGILDRSHLHFFTLRSLRRLLEQCGYAIERLDISYSLPGKLSRAARLLGPLGRWLLGPIAARIARRLPGLFALQFIVTARPAR